MMTKTRRTAAAKPAGRRSTKTSRSRAGAGPTQRAASTVASRLPQVTKAEIAAAKKKFEQGILVRGEAVKAGEPLPPGATHEIVGKRRGGSLSLKRKRFSIK